MHQLVCLQVEGERDEESERAREREQQKEGGSSFTGRCYDYIYSACHAFASKTIPPAHRSARGNAQQTTDA